MLPSLETTRLFLKPYAAGDWPLWHRIISDPKVIFWQDPPLTEDQTRAGFARLLSLAPEGFGWWGVFPKGAEANLQTLLGQIGLQPLVSRPGSIEIAYHFLTGAQGHGFAAEGARAVIGYGFERLRLEEIIGIVLPANAPSQKTIRRAGLMPIGTHLHRGLAHDLFRITRVAWQAAL